VADTLVLQDVSPSGIEIDQTKYMVFQESQTVKPCIGCFGCWVKIPGKCVIKDSDSEFATKLPHVGEVIVVSQLVFGGLSPNIKAIFDRSIGFILPFFCNVNGEMHHRQRYEKRPALRYMLYSESMTEAEKVTATKLVQANAINFGANSYTVDFYRSPQEALEALK